MNVVTRRRGAQWVWRESLPSGFQKVAWVECDASSYFDTGLSADRNMRIVADAAFGTASGDAALFSVGGISGAQWTICALSWSSQFVVKRLASNGQVYLSERDTERHIFILDAERGIAQVDNEHDTIDFKSNMPGSGYTLLVGRDRSGASSKARIYSIRIYIDGVPAMRLVPCYRKDTGEIGLYDTVSDSFFGNAGSGTLTKGADVA